MPNRLVDLSLFADGADPDTGAGAVLRGSRCGDCATVTFPFQNSCPRCAGLSMSAHELPREGDLWAFTVQGFEPKPPYRSNGSFTPYGVGYVDLGEVIVESILTENDPDVLEQVTRVGLCLRPAYTDADGATVLTFAFAPIETESEDN
ncbi:OB-fold domain-containing protein [Nocardia sp. CA2R105]|uniref:Zn-ribbon domain-containing OB-fold protein n=1 Tax=Nocardia coffeae TaxID=2873381 RepID=UPI001CA79DDB|nr:OB-fold domain-containing protein [Nocardia coffeae]MBY8857121.1 OB-fold domain-containing protein [Nocardia coffeae]